METISSYDLSFAVFMLATWITLLFLAARLGKQSRAISRLAIESVIHHNRLAALPLPDGEQLLKSVRDGVTPRQLAEGLGIPQNMIDKIILDSVGAGNEHSTR